MKIVFRIIALLFVVPATYYFIFWAPCSLLPLGEQRWIANVISLTCAVVAGWFVWIKTKSINDGAISTMVFGAVLLGVRWCRFVRQPEGVFKQRPMVVGFTGFRQPFSRAVQQSKPGPGSAS